MEKQQKIFETAEEKVKRISRPIFEEAAKSSKGNSQKHTVGGGGWSSVIVQPHNYRFYFMFKRDSFKQGGLVGVGLGVGLYRHKVVNNGHNHSYKNFLESTIIVRKNQICIQPMKNSRQWLSIKPNEERLKAHEDMLAEQAKKVLERFMAHFGGTSDFVVLKVYCELKIRGDEVIDSIPDKVRIQAPQYRKVYGEDTEFHNVAGLQNYIDNRAIDKVAPVIEAELKANREMLQNLMKSNLSTSEAFKSFADALIPVHKEFAENVASHTKVIKRMADGFDKFNKLLGDKQKRLGDF